MITMRKQKYSAQIVRAGAFILENFKAFKCCLVIETIGLLDVLGDNLKINNFCSAKIGIKNLASDNDFGVNNPRLNDFFDYYKNRIPEIGSDMLFEISRNSVSTEDDIFDELSYKEKMASLFLSVEILVGWRFSCLNLHIILQTLSFLFENWKDMGEEEWNDPYILLEELVNSADFPKTEEAQKTNTEFCEKHQEEIRAFGLALQEDLRKRGVLAG